MGSEMCIRDRFLSNVVHRTRRELMQPWSICYELLKLYIRKIELDPSRTLNFANVFDRGMHDTLLA